MDPASTVSLSQTVISSLVNARPDIHFEGFHDALLRSVGHPDGFINIDTTEMEKEEALKLFSEHSDHIRGVQLSDLPQALPTYGGLFDGEFQLLNTALVSACAAMPNLKEIDLSYSGVTVGAIQSIAMCCKYLKRVVLMNCFGESGDVNSFMYELQSVIDTNRIQIEANCDHAEVAEFYEEQAKAKLQDLGLHLLPEIEDLEDKQVDVLEDAIDMHQILNEKKTSKKEVEV